MNQFQDVYGILALAALKEINLQDEKVCEMKNIKDKLNGFMKSHQATSQIDMQVIDRNLNT